jgi:hypothetical protein
MGDRLAATAEPTSIRTRSRRSGLSFTMTLGWAERSETHRKPRSRAEQQDGFRFALPILRRYDAGLIHIQTTTSGMEPCFPHVFNVYDFARR